MGGAAAGARLVGVAGSGTPGVAGAARRARSHGSRRSRRAVDQGLGKLPAARGQAQLPGRAGRGRQDTGVRSCRASLVAAVGGAGDVAAANTIVAERAQLWGRHCGRMDIAVSRRALRAHGRRRIAQPAARAQA